MAKSKSLIAETKSAVNKAMYNCTKQKKAIALKLLKELTAEVEALKVVVPKKKKSKTSKAKSKPTPIKGLSKMTKAQLLEHLATLSK
tara:strand:+ start:245 stop:505 length:261 start_codon:yes stop_codon:yes gene_type:complete